MSVAQTYGSMNSPKDHFFCLIKKCFRLICLSLAEENVRWLPHNWADRVQCPQLGSGALHCLHLAPGITFRPLLPSKGCVHWQ